MNRLSIAVKLREFLSNLLESLKGMCCRFSSNQKDIKIFFSSSENKHHYHYVRGWRLSSSASRISWCRKFLVGALNSMKLIVCLLQILTFAIWVDLTSVLDLRVREWASLNSMSTVSPVNPAGKEVSHLSSGYNMINRKSDTNKTASFSRYLLFRRRNNLLAV